MIRTQFIIISIQQKGVNTMGIFSTILEKLGLKKSDAPVASAAPLAVEREKDTTSVPATSAAQPEPSVSKSNYEPMPTAISEVDVVKHLEQLSAGSNLDWKVSIVDLLKLLNIDSSREARNSLATELGCPADLMSDSAKMNVWLHKTVLQKIADNGGNIPQSLLK
jgi:hypothetical protein